ncbi:hypothetical protein FGLOB1_1539 [Fusarium globosum]|uniref:Uncharacterized protein n=1 Tax=Fusarium globosum TaxID=78864 RepID=A0A8H6DKQ0_9HYPO|nr:hypothetical protein FGLOB1_1539 [Fusarium globosum]
MNNTQFTKGKQTTVDMETLDGLCHIHILHGYRVCYPIFWDIARDSFNDLDKILGLNEAIDKLLDFDFEAESSNGWSIEQKIWGVRVAIDILEDIVDSPDIAEAFRLGKENAENWVEHAHLLKPGMNVSPYMSAMQDPLLRREVLARWIPHCEFNMPVVPEHLLTFLHTSEGSAPVEEPEKKEKIFRKGIPRGPVDEMTDLLYKVKID